MSLNVKQIFKGGLFSKWAGLATASAPSHGSQAGNVATVASNNADDLSEVAAISILAAVGNANTSNILTIVEIQIT